MYSLMLIQPVFRRKFLVAYLTDEWFLTGVFSSVINQVVIRYPSPITRITLEEPLVCVCLVMFGESATLCCSVVTLVTFVRSFSGMFPDVTCKMATILCRIVTLATGKPVQASIGTTASTGLYVIFSRHTRVIFLEKHDKNQGQVFGAGTDI